ncbi:MAG TPA: VWA domain-containing protein [Roseiflexaceae bacterium]|nr:VWA domain-containing protein [Roseiflexaceae bacterium]
MAPGIRLQRTLSRAAVGASDEQQLVYVLLEATPEGLPAQMPKLPLNLCLVVDRSSSMRGERLMQVKEAAGRIIDQLGQHDFFSLVAFNDRAAVVLPAQRVVNKAELKQAVGLVEAAGGTEMATGMALALQEIQRPMLARGVSRIMLLTDGRTYGDESRCVEIARRAQSRGIGLTALGIGTEWNEDLLETMTASENSRARYITSAQEVVAVFAEELRRMHTVFAQRVRVQLAARPGGLVRALDQVRPYIAPVAIAEEADLVWAANLGDWTGSEVAAFLLELVVPPLPVGEHPVLKLSVRYDLPAASMRDQLVEDVVRLRVVPQSEATYQVDSTVKHWLERLMAYRLQSSAWQAAEAGRLDEATQRLKMASTRLFDAGEAALARTVEEEATRLLNSGAASEEGRKRIKFGTRGLVGGAAFEERETST